MSDWRDVMEARSAADAALREIDPSRVLEDERAPVLAVRAICLELRALAHRARLLLEAVVTALWLRGSESPQDAEGRP